MSKKEKLISNTEIIEIVLKSEKENKEITENEKEKIKKYTGFGELKCILLDPQKPEQFSKSEQNLIPYVDYLHKVFKMYSNSEEEYNRYMDSLKSSVLTAFYTPKEIIDSLNSSFKTAKLKFNRILEPSAGVGMFLNLNGKRYTAFEKDLITGKILKTLYPKEDINIAGFETINQRYKNKFDLVTSNIPFGDFKVFDPNLLYSNNIERRKSCNKIHNYFFEKGLDMLKNGGILSFITSTGVMDSKNNSDFRKHLLQKANLVSAIRLPENTFPNTRVQSDLIILQKNEQKNKLSEKEEKFIVSSEDGYVKNFNYNNYYHNSDKIIHTDAKTGTNLYGKTAIIYEHKGGIGDIGKELTKKITADIQLNLKKDIAISSPIKTAKNQKPIQLSLFNNFIEETSKKVSFIPTEFQYENSVFSSPNSYQINKKQVGLAKDDKTANTIDISEREKEVIKSYISVRDSYFKLVKFETDYQVENINYRKELNTAYDSFKSEYTSLRDEYRLLKEDISFSEIGSIEITKNNREIQKADIFYEPVSFVKKKEEYEVKEALSVCLNKFNLVNLDYISQLTQLSKEKIIEELSGQIFLNPITKRYEQAELFLSGNVIEKMNLSYQAYKNTNLPDFLASAQALHKIIPTKVPLEDIDISLGERWIPSKYYSEFASDVFQTNINVNYNEVFDQFQVIGTASYQSREKYSVKSINRRYNPNKVLEFAMVDNTPEMTRKTVIDGIERRVPDTIGIQKMNAAISLLQEEFKIWTQRLPISKKEELENIYNNKFNCYVKPKLDGSYQTFPDLDYKNLNIKNLYPSQKDAILLLKNQNGGIIDHEVGGGKTLIQCVAAYEMKRLGLANKPCIMGLKANIDDIAKTFNLAYPNAKLLYVTPKDFQKKNREEFFNKIQNNNWDCIIMTHEQFKAIPQSTDIQKKIILEELKKIEDAMSFLLRDADSRDSKLLQKGLLKRKENLESLLEEIIYKLKEKKDSVVDFKTMGIDHLFVDESHKFKNLLFQTRHQRVAGLGNPKGSERALNLLFAIRTMQEKKGQDLCATFLSGTTLSNSLTELYSIFNYLRPEALKKQDIHSFDAWIGTYAIKSKDYEFSVTNDIIQKERFRKFVKVPELAMFYSQITDYKTAEDIGVDRPKKNEIAIVLNQTDQQIDMFSRLQKFAKNGDGTLIYRPPLSDSEEKAKMLIATNTARKASLDMRLIDHNIFKDEANNKTSIVAEKIFEYYQKFNEHKGTQFLFSDIGTYSPNKEFDIYSDIKKKLVDKGVLENEIEFIQTATTERKRQQMIARMNSGECRVIFGSTEMLGTGVNAQKRCVAIHHFDIPWTPKDLEQRNGRGVRKGNEIANIYANNTVDVLIYATKSTLDTYKFNLLKNKAEFISQIKSNKIGVRSIDEGGIDQNTGMSYGEYIAVLSGNTDLLEKAKLEKIITQLKSEENTYLKQVREKEHKIVFFEKEIKTDKGYLSDFMEDLDSFKKLKEKGIEKTTYILNDKKITNPEIIGTTLNAIIQKENRDNFNYQKIGSFGKFDLIIRSELLISENGKDTFQNKLFVEGKLKYSYNNGRLAKDSIKAYQYPINALNRINGLIETYKNRIKNNEDKINSLKELNLSFRNKDKLESSIRELDYITKKIERDLNKNPTNNITEEKSMGRKF